MTMSTEPSLPDYDLDDRRIISSSQEIRAVFHPLRGVLLELLHERAASVAELAEAVGRPKSTVAHHVSVLVEAGALKVVRTRKVRAVEERFYGRTARIFSVGTIAPEQLADVTNLLAVAAAESVAAHEADDLRAIIRYARIPRRRVVEFWDAVFELANTFSQIPRDGDVVYGFVAGLYPSDQPTLPSPSDTGSA